MMPSHAIRHDRESRQRRRTDAAWLTAQAGRKRLLPIIALVVADTVWLLIFFVLLAQSIDRIAFAEPGLMGDPHFQAGLLGLVLVSLLRFWLRRRLDSLATTLAHQTTARLRRSALSRCMSPARRSHGDAHPGDLATRLSEQLDQLAPWYREYLPARTQAVVQPLLILILVFSQDWLAGLLLLLAAPLIPLFSALIGFGSASLAEDQHQQLSRMGRHFLDRIRALPTLRLMQRTREEVRAVGQAAEAYRESSMKVLRVAFLSSAVLEFFSAVAIASLAIYIGLALLGYLEFGPAPALGFQAGLTILLLAPEFFQPLRRLAAGYHERASALAAVPRIRPLLPTEPASLSSPRSVANRWAHPPRLRVQGLDLAWPGAQRPLFEGLDLDLAAGEWLAIQGASGSGKSSLAAVLLGWLAPSGGQLFLDERALDSLPEAERRKNLAWLGQQAHLLPVSLRRNLDPGARYGESALLERLASLGLSPLVERLPHGLDTVLGERGAGLSGGEAQRLALARALLGEPRLLILDEPTASIDPDNETRVLAALRHCAGEHSIVMFTHSHTAAAAADRRLQLRAGRLVDED